MINIAVSKDCSRAESLIAKCLKEKGFDVRKTEEGLYVQSSSDKHKLSSVVMDRNCSYTQLSLFPENPLISNVFEFIELNYRQNIGLKDVATAVGYSSAYLTHLLKRRTGTTVNNLIIERRISEAGRLLIETEDSIEKIAEKVGYQSTNHFYRQFRKRHNSTPRKWRVEQDRLRFIALAT
ncbi:MAG: AraC family transcriptional regulator [Phormidesmis sp.]